MLGLPAWPIGGSPITGRIIITTATGSNQFAPTGKTWLILNARPHRNYFWIDGSYIAYFYNPGFAFVTENRGGSDAYYCGVTDETLLVLELDTPSTLLAYGSVCSTPKGIPMMVGDINSSTATRRGWGFSVSGFYTKVYEFYGVREAPHYFTPMCLTYGTISTSLLNVGLCAVDLPGDWPFVSNDYTISAGATITVGTVGSNEMWLLTLGRRGLIRVIFNTITDYGSGGFTSMIVPPSTTIQLKNDDTSTQYAAVRILKLPAPG